MFGIARLLLAFRVTLEPTLSSKPEMTEMTLTGARLARFNDNIKNEKKKNVYTTTNYSNKQNDGISFFF